MENISLSEYTDRKGAWMHLLAFYITLVAHLVCRSLSALMPLSVLFDTMYSGINKGAGYRWSSYKTGKGLD